MIKTITVKRAMLAGAAALLAASLSGPALAQACHGGQSFERWLDEFKREAAAKGVSGRTLAAASRYMTFDPSVVRSDRGQRVFTQDFLTFAGRMVEQYRVAHGANHLKRNQSLFDRIEREFGVPGPVLVAFWGLETDFGANIGDMPTLRALTSLAYDCRRPDMFRAELLAALRIIERGDLTAEQMIGPWAGELGQLQFLPTHYFDHAVDYTGDGRRDLLRSPPDALASAANYMANQGWRRGEPWLEEVRVPASLAWEQADITIQHPRAYWAKAGVARADGRALPSDSLPASLVLPMGRNGPAFLAYPNFHIFLEWNQSLVYATTAAYMAARLAGAPRVGRGRGQVQSLSFDQMKELQTLLKRQGHDVGGVDGILGEMTRAAVRQAQLKFGMPADSYPTPELLQRLRR